MKIVGITRIRNEAKVIGHTLDHLRGFGDEVYVLDDCSTDNSVDVILDMIKDDSRFMFCKNTTNKGCGFTKAKCIELAKGDICGFLDGDDALTANTGGSDNVAIGKTALSGIITQKRGFSLLPHLI